MTAVNEDVAATDGIPTVADLDPRILVLRERSENRVCYSRYVATGPRLSVHGHFLEERHPDVL